VARGRRRIPARNRGNERPATRSLRPPRHRSAGTGPVCPPPRSASGHSHERLPAPAGRPAPFSPEPGRSCRRKHTAPAAPRRQWSTLPCISGRRPRRPRLPPHPSPEGQARRQLSWASAAPARSVLRSARIPRPQCHPGRRRFCCNGDMSPATLLPFLRAPEGRPCLHDSTGPRACMQGFRRRAASSSRPALTPPLAACSFRPPARPAAGDLEKAELPRAGDDRSRQDRLEAALRTAEMALHNRQTRDKIPVRASSVPLTLRREEGK